MKTIGTALIAILLALPNLGCQVPLKAYRLNHPAIEVPPPLPLSASVVPAATADKDCEIKSSICLAFIELDDMGEPYRKGQLDTALRVIREANAAAAEAAPDAAPIVITFVHGWKNNASEDNGNVKGFTAALREIYGRAGGRRVIGIYIGWRGDLVSKYMPIARQFTYYNREATAIRIPGVTLASALTQIAATAHENRNSSVTFVGHSFGGLLLERTISEATASQIAQASIFEHDAIKADAAAVKAPQEEAKKALRQVAVEKHQAALLATDARPDLVVFINPAGAATEAKQMLDFLTGSQLSFQPSTSDSHISLNHDDDRPLFVSLSSTTDLATKVALPIGHYLPYVKFKLYGSFRSLGGSPDEAYSLKCYDPHKKPPYSEEKTKSEGAQAQGSNYLSSAPHTQVLQSHVMLKAVSANEMKVASTGDVIHFTNSKAIAGCDRQLLNQEHPGIVSTFRLSDTNTCFAVQEKTDRCNGTPYWIMELDPDVVPDHGTIFTQRFIEFLIDTFFTPSQKGSVLHRDNPVLKVSVQ